jgi:uncharacterized protein (DUF849 family)
MTNPVIITLAINGETSKKRNPHVPHKPEEIVADAVACFGAGVAVVHNHMGDITLTGEAAAERYALAWRPIREAVPDAILCPTTQQAPDLDERLNFLGPAKKAGARLASIDPGVENFATSGENGLPGAWRACTDFTIDRVELAFGIISRLGLGLSLGIYEPGFLRLVLAFKRAGVLPRGTIANLYFGGDHNFLDGVKGGYTFGLPPTHKALDAYVEMIGDSGITWGVAVPGGDLYETGLARYAVERGGHLRIGLEDHAADRRPTNLQLVEEVVGVCHAAGKRPASRAEAARILDLP